MSVGLGWAMFGHKRASGKTERGTRGVPTNLALAINSFGHYLFARVSLKVVSNPSSALQKWKLLWPHFLPVTFPHTASSSSTAALLLSISLQELSDQDHNSYGDAVPLGEAQIKPYNIATKKMELTADHWGEEVMVPLRSYPLIEFGLSLSRQKVRAQSLLPDSWTYNSPTPTHKTTP